MIDKLSGPRFLDAQSYRVLNRFDRIIYPDETLPDNVTVTITWKAPCYLSDNANEVGAGMEIFEKA